KTAEGHEALGVVQNGLPIPKSAENLSAYAVQRISAKKTDEKAESKPVSAPSLLHFATRENFSFSLLNSGNVSIFLVNAKGEIVWRQKLESLPAGTNTIGWNVANLPNGSYQLRIEAENSVQGYKIGL
ncbi:MAG: hypothetical protein FWH22_06000, partial [Fibromonadales bacterium]|nr:hypothetical protein [Fibromonadales bacterium]